MVTGDHTLVSGDKVYCHPLSGSCQPSIFELKQTASESDLTIPEPLFN